MWKKRTAVLMAAVLLMLSLSAYAQTVTAEGQYVVELADGAIIVNEAGEPITERGSFGMMYELTGLPDGIRRYAAEQGAGSMSALYALLDENGKPLTEYSYMMLEYVDGAIMFIRNELMGVMDLQGRVVIEPEYTYMVSCGDGNYLALRTNPYDDSADMIYHVSADGSEHATGNKTALLGEFDEEGLCVSLSPDNFQYGYIDAQGQWVIEPKFEWAGGFAGGQAAANTSDGAGLIDPEGNWLVAPQYDYVTFEGDSLIVTGSGNTVSLIDPQTFQPAASFTESGLHAVGIGGGRAGVMTENGITVIDRTGAEVFSLESYTALSLWAGMKNELIVTLGESGNANTYLCSMTGAILSDPYQDIIPLGMGEEGMYYMFVTYEATQVEYDNGMSFWDEIPGTRRCGVLSAAGEELCAFDAEYISWCGDGYMVIYQENGRAFADVSGNIIAEFEDLTAPMSADAARQLDEAGFESGE